MKRIFALLITISLIFACFPILPVSAIQRKPEDVFYYVLEYKDKQEVYYDEAWEADALLFSSSCDAYKASNSKSDKMIESMKIRLEADVTTKYFPLLPKTNINIDLNGHTWTVTNTESGLYTYKNITISGGTLTFQNSPSCPIYSYGGEIRLRNVIFKDCVCSRYGLICSESNPGGSTLPYAANKGGIPIINKASVLGEQPQPGSLHFDNVRFENCSSTSYGGCIYIKSKNAEHSFNNCKFNNCTSAYGGCMYIEGSNTRCNFFNCEFTHCSASTDGGAIYCESEKSKLCFTNCNAYRCHANDCGGFIFCSGQNTVYNGSGDAAVSTLGQRSNIIGCYALGSGGAFYSSLNNYCSNYSELRNFNMAYNTAGASKHNFDAVKSRNSNSWGGAVCFCGTDMKLCYCDLYSNYANWYGGAVYCGYRRTSVENCTFYENRCSDGYGNDIYLDSATQYVSDCTFYTNDNSVAGYKAAIWSNNTVSYLEKQYPFSTSEEIAEGDYIISTAIDEKFAVDIAGGTTAVNVQGANVHLWENGDAEVFTITKDPAKGTYIIKSKVTGLVLDVSGGSKENGANIQQWGSNGTDAQRWVFEPTDNGYYYIRCVGGQYMDASGMVGGAKPTNDVNIQSWTFTGADNQKFKLVKVSGDTKTEIDSKSTTGNGSKEKPYKISNAEQWKAFAISVLLGKTYSGKYFELTDDISVSYIPVGYFNQNKSFKGNFDGKNHTVHYLDAFENWDRGLFSYCVDATIKNLRVTGKIYGTVTLAGVCAAAQNTTFENCTNDVDVTSINDRNIAGICGIANNCKFINCVNNGKIHGGSYISGGIVALAEGGKSEFIRCRNNGNVYTSNDNAGGMVGEATVHITAKRCTNNARIESGNVTAAGMVGCLRKGADIISCINTEKGVIGSKQYSAGMIGWTGSSNEQVNVKNCVNCGGIRTSVGDSGGIVVNLNNDNMSVVNCFNSATKIPYFATKTGEIAEGDYIISTAIDEKFAVDIEGGKCAVNVADANVHLWENGEANVFTITKDKNKDAYIIKSKVTGLVLDVLNASKKDGANIHQWGSNGSDAQRWVFEYADNGYYYIRCLGGQYMDADNMVDGNKPSNGVNIHSWSFTGADNQKFKIVSTSGKAASTIGAISSATGKGTYTNCYYLSGGIGDKYATALSQEDCKDRLMSEMNTYIRENTTSKERSDWPYWSVNNTLECAIVDFASINNCLIEGSGTEKDPYIISNAEQMEEFANDVRCGVDYSGKYVELTKSFIYNGPTIGTENHPFKGIFDGKGHTLTVQLNGKTFVGVFSQLDGATVKNLEVGGLISGSSSVAAIAGFAYGGTVINNCHSTASIEGTAENIGGIVGMMDNSIISNCRVDGSVTTSGWTSIGGVVGGFINGGKIVNCVSTATVTGEKAVGGIVGCVMWGDLMIVNSSSLGSTAEYVKKKGNEHGGIVGFINSDVNSVSIYSCFTNCKVGGTKYRGLIVGNNTAGSKVKCENVNYVTCTGVSNTSGTGTKVTASKTIVAYLGDTVTELNNYTSNNRNIIEGAPLTDWTREGNNIFPKNFVSTTPPMKGTGTQNNPYRIIYPEHLIEISNKICDGADYKGKQFRLTKNLEYSGAPIGMSGRPFEGVLDGGDYKITAEITGNDHTALFSETSGATIKNLKITGNVSGTNSVAGIVGYAHDRTVIDNCCINANITATDSCCGGIVGESNGSTIKNCRIDSTDTSAKISGTSCVAGVVGHAYGGSLIDNCYVNVPVTGTAENIGGIAGMMFEATVTNCRVDSKITGGWSTVGGIAGWFHYNCKVANCVKTGDTVGGKAVGGIVGYVQDGDSVIANCSSIGTVSSNASGRDSTNCGGIVGHIGKDIHSIKLYCCFANCNVKCTYNHGYICGNNERTIYEKIDAENYVIDDEKLFYVEAGDKNAFNNFGVHPPYCEEVNADNMSEILDKLNTYIKNYSNKIDGVTLSDWSKTDDNLFPKNYEDNSSLIASVFSRSNLPALIIIVGGVLAGVIGVAVLEIRKKKKVLIHENQKF